MVSNQVELPPGWSAHPSKSFPGYTYYYNSFTGQKTWKIQDLVGLGNRTEGGAIIKDVMVASTSNDHINELGIHDLKKLLEIQKQSISTLSSNQKDSNANATVRTFVGVDGGVPKSKRKKIEFDVKIEAKKINNKDVDSQSGKEFDHKDDEHAANNESKESNCMNNSTTKTNSNTNNNETLCNSSSDSSMYGMDEDEMLQLKKISSKFAPSPPRIKVPKKSSINTGTNNDFKTTSEVSTKAAKYLEENYGCRYVNYQSDAKETYQRVFKPRIKPALTNLEKSNTNFPLPLASSLPKNYEKDLDRTPPEHDLNTTPVYGSLENSLEDDEINQEEVCIDNFSGSSPRSSSQGDSPSDISVNNILTSNESSDGDISYEGERPKTPTLVQEVIEEECLEDIDLNELMNEIKKVRTSVCEETEIDDQVECSKNDTEIFETKEDQLVFVLDTNVLLARLDLLEQLKSKNVRIVIPLIVAKELVALQLSDNKKISIRARAASRWLNSMDSNSSNCPVIKQTKIQEHYASEHFDGSTSDEKVLACCRMLKENEGKIFLVSTDSDLSTKATFNNVKSMTIKEFERETSNESDLPDQEVSVSEVDESMRCHELINQCTNILRDILEAVLRKECIVQNGEKTWMKNISIKPRPSKPYWTLNDLFKLYNKPTTAILGNCFPLKENILRSQLTKIKDKLNQSELSVHAVTMVLSDTIDVLDIVKERDSYDGIVDICQDKLTDVKYQLEELSSIRKGITKSRSVEGSISSAQESIQLLFQNVWEIIACFTKGYANTLSVSNSLPNYEPDIKFKSLTDAIRTLPAFFQLVSTLQESMLKVVTNKSRGLELLGFYNLLTQFRNNLELDQSFWPSLNLSITPIQLETFLEADTNFHIVTGGLDQISEFRQILIQCISGGGEHC